MKNMSFSNYSLTPILREHQALVLNWRNSERIRAVSRSDHRISEEEHAQWFASLQGDSQRDYQIFQRGHQPLGLSSFTDIGKAQQEAEWGFYIGEPNQPPGTGKALGFLSMEYGFKILKLKMIRTSTFGFNEIALNFQKSLGFKLNLDQRQSITKNGQQVEIESLFLTHEIWSARRENLIYELL